jgi:hypothetical protein
MRHANRRWSWIPIVLLFLPSTHFAQRALRFDAKTETTGGARE